MEFSEKSIENGSLIMRTKCRVIQGGACGGSVFLEKGSDGHGAVEARAVGVGACGGKSESYSLKALITQSSHSTSSVAKTMKKKVSTIVEYENGIYWKNERFHAKLENLEVSHKTDFLPFL